MSKFTSFQKFCLGLLLLMATLEFGPNFKNTAQASPGRPILMGSDDNATLYVGDWLKEIHSEMKEQTKQQKRIADALEKCK